MLVVLTGCASHRDRTAELAVADYFIGDYDRAVSRLQPLAQKPDENFVLNNVRLGSAALVNYDLVQAEAAFLRAYEVINSVGVNDGGRTLGAVLVDEKLRIWRGEPYERAMANFYLGLTYYMRGDYGNARAALENALFKLRDYGSGEAKAEEYREIESNFALAYILLGRCHQRLGDPGKAQDMFTYASSKASYLQRLADPGLHARSNVLLAVDFGHGPRKITTFDGAIVGFAPTVEEEGLVPPPQVIVDGNEVPLHGLGVPPVDLLLLAQDRRWQSLDTLRTVKSAVGTGLIVGGAYEATRHDGNAGLGIALIGAGLLLKATSQADIRQWEMLPRTVFLIPLQLPPGRHDITVDFPNVPGLRQTWRGIEVPERGEVTYYFRPIRNNAGPFQWPPPTIARGRDGMQG